MRQKSKKETLTYYGNKKIKKDAMKRAKKVGMTIGEVIDSYLEKYAELPIYKMVHDGSVVKESAETIPLT